LKKIVLAFSALAASPAKALPRPPGVLLVDLEAGGAGVTGREDRRRGEPGQRPADEEARDAHPTTTHSARSL